MAKAVEKIQVPYVLEDDRGLELKEQTVFYIMPKTGHDSNRTLQRYSSASKEGRKGTREIDVNRLDSADTEEFLAVVVKVEGFFFASTSKFYNNGLPGNANTPEELIEVQKSLSSEHLQEIFEVSGNISKLSAGAKKNSKS